MNQNTISREVIARASKSKWRPRSWWEPERCALAFLLFWGAALAVGAWVWWAMLSL